jgi:hypothetical protein
MAAVAPLLNHTIVWCRDKRMSANYLAELLDRPEPEAEGPFLELITRPYGSGD